ncbi:HpcH/HpaI aldolase/citrate lyase family protein [Paraferrimonas sedimenticola]|uniref:CoA ester lyase n=1 Tax=Paraferrimonas sedimenticola TaxID=375674 RepID=A0AA37VW23_9GAMM|nr:CoA ester lyase [Paraferrimonas sedimenticola]GLP96326.1 CoA ester lyase [Paraferrimonas sedimenticola]
MSPLIRSLLFVPANRPERYAKALAAGADLVCIDLEDAVPAAEKPDARIALQDFLAENQAKVCVRINPMSTPDAEADLAALKANPPAVVMLAKCEGPQELAKAHQWLQSESTQWLPLVETIEGLKLSPTLSQAGLPIAALMFGGADFSVELGCEFAYEPLLFARSELVMAAAAQGLSVIDVPYIQVSDEAGLIDETHKVKALGFTGKSAIHPKQIVPIHNAYQPTPAQIEQAQAVIAAAEQSQGGAVMLNGRMLDKPVIAQSERILALAAAAANAN